MKDNLTKVVPSGIPQNRTSSLLTCALPRKVKQVLHSARSRILVWRARCLLRKNVLATVKDGKHLRVIIGAASTKYEEWLSTDLPILNALNPGHWRNIFPPGSIDRILAEHVIEHCQC